MQVPLQQGLFSAGSTQAVKLISPIAASALAKMLLTRLFAAANASAESKSTEV